MQRNEIATKNRWRWYMKAVARMAWELGYTVEEKDGWVYINNEAAELTTRHCWLAAYRQVLKDWEAAGHKFMELASRKKV